LRSEILEVKNLTVAFGGLTAVRSLDFMVAEHEIVSLIGPNGAGKTTTFNALSGFVKKKEGKVIFGGGGREMFNLRPHQIAERGLVRTFQITSLFPGLSVMDNIRTARHIRNHAGLFDALFNTGRNRRVEEDTDAQALEILSFVNLKDKNDRIAANLPYGEQRSLEIAVALATAPKMLLLDEPSAGLNNTETCVMMELIMRLRDRGITILLVEHDMKLVMEVSDRIIVLNFGEKIAEGTPVEIMCNQEVITAYLGRERKIC
jgi:branched-chain amino acid transport system ATP-binding protein